MPKRITSASRPKMPRPPLLLPGVPGPQVLAGIGVDVAGQLAAAPKQRVAARPQQQAQQEAASEEDDLIARLAQLK